MRNIFSPNFPHRLGPCPAKRKPLFPVETAVKVKLCTQNITLSNLREHGCSSTKAKIKYLVLGKQSWFIAVLRDALSDAIRVIFAYSVQYILFGWWFLIPWCFFLCIVSFYSMHLLFLSSFTHVETSCMDFCASDIWRDPHPIHRAIFPPENEEKNVPEFQSFLLCTATEKWDVFWPSVTGIPDFSEKKCAGQGARRKKIATDVIPT